MPGARLVQALRLPVVGLGAVGDEARQEEREVIAERQQEWLVELAERGQFLEHVGWVGRLFEAIRQDRTELVGSDPLAGHLGYPQAEDETEIDAGVAGHGEGELGAAAGCVVAGGEEDGG